MIGWIGIPLAIVFGDGAVKKCAERQLADGRKKQMIKDRIHLHLLHNHGVALGALGKQPKLILVLNSALLGVAIGEFTHILEKEGETVAKTGLALLIGGGMSNLIDRLQRGYVTDYFSINPVKWFKGIRTVVFNCSDFCVFAGILFYVFGKNNRT